MVIGVTAPGAGFKAHAWLDGEPAATSAGYTEVSRRPPPTVRTAPLGSARVSSSDGGHQAVEQSGKVPPRP